MRTVHQTQLTEQQYEEYQRRYGDASETNASSLATAHSRKAVHHSSTESDAAASENESDASNNGAATAAAYDYAESVHSQARVRVR